MNQKINSSIRLYEEYFKLQNVKEGEKVVILSGQQYDRTILEPYQMALANLGADFYTMFIPPKIKKIQYEAKPGTDFVFDSIKDSGLVLTLPGAMIMYGTERGIELLKSGVRSLHNSIDEQTLRRLWPTKDIIDRTFRGVKIIEAAKIMKFTSKAGTNLVYDKTGRGGHCQCSLAHVPGRWDNSGYGKADSGPPYNSVEGTLVINSGDYMAALDRIVVSPIRCTIKDGYITNIEGGADATLLKTWLNSWKDPESYRCSHAGYGTNDGAIWVGRGSTGTDRYNYYGGLQIAFGSNTLITGARYSGTDVKIEAASHLDIDLLNHSMWLDDAQIIDEGVIVHPECK